MSDTKILYGDGEHDDTDALQAWADGESVIWPDGSPVTHEIRGRSFLFSRTVVVDPEKRKGLPVLEFHDNRGRTDGRNIGCFFRVLGEDEYTARGGWEPLPTLPEKWRGKP